MVYQVEITEFGTFWRVGDKLHREGDLPAAEFADGRQDWYMNGNRHREHGAAIIYPHGDKEWWLHGNRITEEEFELHHRNLIHLSVAQLQQMGYKIIITKI